ncbi:hypothetical protein K3495_g4525 [Podosphaera aphanis]|nr:hypothetical protein K3495_g4525 [Podosphaera aphanis]
MRPFAVSREAKRDDLVRNLLFSTPASGEIAFDAPTVDHLEFPFPEIPDFELKDYFFGAGNTAPGEDEIPTARLIKPKGRPCKFDTPPPLAVYGELDLEADKTSNSESDAESDGQYQEAVHLSKELLIESPFCLQSWRNKVELQSGKKLQAVGSGNVPELKKAINERERASGFQAEQTVIALSNQNGVAERSIHTAENSTGAMLEDARLPIEFWDEAVEADA